MPTDRSLTKTTVDQDWAKLLHAKSLVSGPGSFGFSAAIARNHSDPNLQTRTPAYWHGVFPCSAMHYHVDMPNPMHLTTEEYKYRYVNPQDRTTQQPVQNHLMHESGR